jgi:hypothetical protein
MRLVLVAMAFVACNRSTDPPRVETVPASSVAPPREKPPAGTTWFPPAGEYEMTPSVLEDDCQEKLYSTSPVVVTVRSWTSERGFGGKLEAPVFSARRGNDKPSQIASLWHGFPSHDVHPKSMGLFTDPCPRYEIKRSWQLIAHDPTHFVVLAKEEHGDGMHCSRIVPSKCTTVSEHTYRLQKAACPAGCPGIRTDDAGAILCDCER